MLKKLFVSSVVVAGIVFSASVFAKTEVKSGYFNITNNTDKVVKVGVGNWFPTQYTVGPHATVPVFVSTDNQNIQINGVS